MRKTGLLALLVAFGSLACSGSDSSANGTTPNTDSGSNSPSSPTTTNQNDANAPDADGPRGPKAIAPSITAYFGPNIQFDGSQSTGPTPLTYDWKLDSAPDGSMGSFVMATNVANPVFMPDLVGTYVFSFTVTSGDKSDSAKVTLTLVDAPVFYWTTSADGGGASAALEVVGASAGDAGTKIACFEKDAGDYGNLPYCAGAVGTDWWEAPPGQPSKVVTMFETYEDGGATTKVVATTSDATCATPPKVLDSAAGAAMSTIAFSQPRLSPNGNRVAYVRKDLSGPTVTTVGFDGSDRRILGTGQFAPDGGPSSVERPGPRPVWLDDTNVAWFQADDASNWKILSAKDSDNATPTVFMTCSGEPPSQFDVLSTGEVIVSQKLPVTGGTATNVVTYAVDAATKACGTPKSLSRLEKPSSSAIDFSLSPDKKYVAFKGCEYQGGCNYRTMWVVADGATAPNVLESPDASAQRGPRWVASGNYVAWGASAANADGGTNSFIAVAEPGAPNYHRVATLGAGTSLQAVGNGNLCSYAPGVGSGVSLVGFASLLALRLARRRRREQ